MCQQVPVGFCDLTRKSGPTSLGLELVHQKGKSLLVVGLLSPGQNISGSKSSLQSPVIGETLLKPKKKPRDLPLPDPAIPKIRGEADNLFSG